MAMSIIAESKCKLSRRVKRSWILEAIRDRKLVSRNDLVEITGLSAPVVTRLTKELIEEKFIEEVGKGEASTSGRKPIWLSLSKSTKFLIGIDVGAYECKAVLTNLNCEVIGQCSALTPRDRDGQVMIDFLLGLVDNLLSGSRIRSDLLQGIALAIPGVINVETGEVILFCNVPAMKNLQVVKPIKSACKVPVILTSTGGVWLMSECERAGKDRKAKDFLLIHCGYGVGIGPLINGKAPVGRNPQAKIDFGHVTHDPAGPPCNCGSRGCVEAYTGGWAIERTARANPSQQLLDLVDGKVEAITAKDVFDAALRGDRSCFGIIHEAGTILGRNLAQFIQYYMPRRVIFAGGLVAHNSLYMDAVIQEISRRMPEDRFRQFEMQVTSLDKYAGAVGATHYLAHEILHAPVEDVIRVTW